MQPYSESDLKVTNCDLKMKRTISLIFGDVKMHKDVALVPRERIERSILLIRGQKVMLSTDLAELYQVEPRVLVQAVKRNIARFPEDFMFQLTEEEFSNLKSQIVISSWGGLRRARPYAFTEQGVAMLSSVLRSKRAIQVNIEIMRAFVRLRRMLASHADLARKLEALEKKYDAQFKVVFEAIRELMKPPETKETTHRISGGGTACTFKSKKQMSPSREPRQTNFCFIVTPYASRFTAVNLRYALCATCPP